MAHPRVIHEDHGHAGPRPRAGADRRALAIVFVLTSAFLVAEVIGGLLTGSLALLADAGHMASDAVSLGLALFAVWLAERPATPHRSFGYKRAEILAALANGVTLVAVSVWIFVEAFARLQEPPQILGGWMLAVALVGLASTSRAPSSSPAPAGRASTSRVPSGTSWPTSRLVGVIVAAASSSSPRLALRGPHHQRPHRPLVLGSSWRLLRDSPTSCSSPRRQVSTPARSAGDGRRPWRIGGTRPARLDDNFRLSGARRPRARRPQRKLPRAAARPRRPSSPATTASSTPPSKSTTPETTRLRDLGCAFSHAATDLVTHNKQDEQHSGTGLVRGSGVTPGGAWAPLKGD